MEMGFGAMVRQARLAHSWKQADLAKRVGMSQRAVSNWERGAAEPEDAVKDQVLAALGLRDPAAAGAVRAEPVYPGRALVDELPLEQLSPEDFEEFIADLMAASHPGAFVNRIGKTGHTQDGYDVHVKSSGALVVGVQCKREAQFGPRKVADAVDEVRKAATKDGAEPVGASVIALSRIASPDARKEMRKHPGWELWDRNDLSRKVRELSLDRAVPIVRRFFPLMLTDFLGVVRPGPWLDNRQYIDRWYADKIYTHRWRLVGSSDAVDILAGFAARSQGGIRLLTGLGGSGKTKVLTEVCRRAAAGGVAVRILEPDTEVGPESFEQLPSGALLVIVDDAHDESVPLGRVVAGVQGANPQANILVSLRPYGSAHVRTELRRVGFHSADMPEMKVPELDLEAATELACEVLDESLRHFGPQLAAAASDCPLLITTGAALVNRGELNPEGFQDDQRLHAELIDRLAEALTAQSEADNPARRDVLTALAAYQPVDLSDAQTRTSLEQLTGLDFAQTGPLVSGLEDAGLVLRRGATVRVVPDLLGDALLSRAARHRGAEVPTGYLDKALSAAQGTAVRNLIVNAGRVDWQAADSGPDGSGLIEPLWRLVEAAFRDSDAADRAATLELVAKIAFYQPRRSLQLVQWAMAHPAKPASKGIGFGFTHAFTDDDVRQALAQVLRPIAWYPELFPKAAELLWTLAAGDGREPHRFPDHPRRVLQELASFTRQGPTWYQRTLVGLVDRWLNRYQGTGISSPLIVLGPLLATSGHDEQWTPGALVFKPYALVPAPQVLELRSAVLGLAFAQLGSDRPDWAAEAAGLIGAAFTLAPAGFGLTISEELQQDWSLHFAEVLQRLHEFLTDHPLGPTMLVAVRGHLQWTGEYGPEQLRRRAQAIAKDMPTTAEHRLARALHGGPVDPVDSPDLVVREQLQQSLLTDAVSGIADWPDEQVAHQISALLRDERAVFGPDTGRARPFIWELITKRPSLGPVFCTHAAAEPESPLRPLVSITLCAMGQAGQPETIKLGRQLADNDIELARQVAHAVGLQRGRNTLLPGEADLLKALASDSDPVVADAAAGAARYLATAGHQELAVELLFAALPHTGLHQIALAFGPQPYGTPSWASLPEQRKTAVLRALATCSSIEDYETGQLLAQITLTDPGRVVEVLQCRVELAEQDRPPEFTPLPPVWHTILPFRESPQLPELLRQVREWLAAAPGSAWRAYLGSELFALVAGPFDAQALEVIYDYVDHPDPAKMQVVAVMLRGAPRELAWNTEAVRRILRAADRCGPESLTLVQSALIDVGVHSQRRTMAGGPFAAEAELHSRAQTLAAACLPGSVEEQFYQDLAASAARSVDAWAALREATTPPDDRRNWG
ncbi:restriction endonuclease [Streptacidiphilus sp. BW17]|uniref:helix-turn-helix domain-containing protein n=1 Tax=Streptacidiphilus sp. BW17 TaxID=3156274 RepID=UPI003519984B